MKKIKIILISYFIVFSIFMTYKTISIEAQVSSITSNNKQKGLDITLKQYYTSLLINDDNYRQITNENQNYILYFHQENCDYCYESNLVIDEYISSNKEQIYFLTPISASKIFKKYEVESTPTIIVFKNSIQVEKIVGSKNIIDYINTLNQK